MRQRLLAGEIECQHGRHPGGIVPCGRHDRRLNVQRVALTGLENGLYGTCGLGLQLNQLLSGHFARSDFCRQQRQALLSGTQIGRWTTSRPI